MTTPTVESKRYFSTQPFTTIQVMVGPGICEPHNFINHQLDTTNPNVMAYLDPLVDKPGTGIVSMGRDQIEAQVNQAAHDVRQAAEKAHARAVAAGLATA